MSEKQAEAEIRYRLAKYPAVSVTGGNLLTPENPRRCGRRFAEIFALKKGEKPPISFESGGFGGDSITS